MKIITSIKNEYILRLQKLLNKKDRIKEQLFIVEGKHLVDESKSHLVSVLSSDEQLLKNYSCETYLVTEEIIKKLSSTVNPQPILGIVKMLNHEPNIIYELLKSPKVKLLMLDNINDPGNLGTILRTSAALGMDAVIISEDTVDIYNDKVLRSTQGNLFKIPIVKTNLLSIIDLLKENHIISYGTSLQKSIPVSKVKKEEKFVIVLGNEANGVSDKVLKQMDYNIKIPMKKDVESLNVSIAGAILMYEFLKD